jgi:uncharacterized membrane protein
MGHDEINTAAPAASPRVEAVDLVRGVVMVLMALDHVRAFFTDPRLDPLAVSAANAPLFFTRWVTHFCAPTFVFLAGTGAYLSAGRGKSRPELARFLATRGLWLVALEFTLVHLGWSFGPDYRLMLGQVIWAIGWSMVALAGLVFLPVWLVTILGVVLIAGHNLLDGIKVDDLGNFAGLWKALVSPGLVEPLPGVRIIVAYPVLPWLGVMLAGYGCGALWRLDPARRRLWLLALGGTLVLLFVALRFANGYGDPAPWSPQATNLATVLSLLKCTKYPPSLLFVLMTLGPALVLLACCDRPPGPLGRVFVTFGRVPLFYYLLHVPLIHLVALAFATIRYGEADFLYQHVLSGGSSFPADYGYGLPVVYAVWLGVVLLLYPCCRWFADLKSRNRSVWLSYF